MIIYYLSIIFFISLTISPFEGGKLSTFGWKPADLSLLRPKV